MTATRILKRSHYPTYKGVIAYYPIFSDSDEYLELIFRVKIIGGSDIALNNLTGNSRMLYPPYQPLSKKGIYFNTMKIVLLDARGLILSCLYCDALSD